MKPQRWFGQACDEVCSFLLGINLLNRFCAAYGMEFVLGYNWTYRRNGAYLSYWTPAGHCWCHLRRIAVHLERLWAYWYYPLVRYHASAVSGAAFLFAPVVLCCGCKYTLGKEDKAHALCKGPFCGCTARRTICYRSGRCWCAVHIGEGNTSCRKSTGLTTDENIRTFEQ